MLNKLYCLFILSVIVQTSFAQSEFLFVKIQPGSIADTIPSSQLSFANGFGKEVTEPVIGQLVYAPEDINGNRFLCDTPMIDFTDKFVLIDRGVCFFTDKAFQAQELGAIGVIFRNGENNIIPIAAPVNYEGNVNIPVVLIPYDVGIDMEEALIKEDTVIVGFFPDLSLKIINFQKDLSLKVYPNPMTDFSWFELEGTKVQPGTLQIFDMMGRMLKEVSFSQNKFQLKRDFLSQGNYFFKLSNPQIPVIATGMIQIID